MSDLGLIGLAQKAHEQGGEVPLNTLLCMVNEDGKKRIRDAAIKTAMMAKMGMRSIGALEELGLAAATYMGWLDPEEAPDADES